MSAPDPKAWEEPDDDPETLEFAYRIARRRALAELKALLADTYVPYVNQHYGGPAPTLLDADVIVSRIAAIEAEEA